MVLLENNTPKVLLVDDKAENLAILVDMLKPLNLELFVALSAKEAFERVKSYEFDLILLDIIMPEIDGYEVCKRLKNNPKYKNFSIVDKVVQLTDDKDRLIFMQPVNKYILIIIGAKSHSEAKDILNNICKSKYTP